MPFCSDKVKQLHQMFPKASADHITKCLRQANGHMDTTVELLLACCQVRSVIVLGIGFILRTRPATQLMRI